MLQSPGEFGTSHDATAYYHIANQSLVQVIRKSKMSHKTLVYKSLNELSVHKIVHDGVTPSLTMVRDKLTPHGIVTFYPLLQGNIVYAFCPRREEDHVLWPCVRVSVSVDG